MATGKGSTSGIKAGEAFVLLSTDRREFDKGLKAARKELSSFANSAGSIGRSLAIAGGALGTPILAGLGVFQDFETQMKMVSTMLSDPAKFMPEYTKAIDDMSVRFGEGTEVLTKGLYDILSASIDPAQALDVLTVSVKAATAGMTDTGVAADGLTTMLNAYGLAADQAGTIMDWFFTVVERGKTTFPELAANIGQVATLAASASVSIDELGAMLAAMTKAGIKTDQAITGLKAIISTFMTTEPTDIANKVAQEYGFSLNAATLKAEGLLGVIKKLQEVSPEDAAAMFPNIRALTGLLPAIQNIQGLSNDMAAMANKAGAGERAFNKMMDTLKQDSESARKNVLSLLAAMGNAASGDARSFLQTFSDIVTKMKEFIEENPVLVTGVGKVALVLGSAGAALIGVAGAVKVLSGALAILHLNPAILGASALVTGMYLLSNAIDEAYTYTAKLSNAVEKRRQQDDEQRRLDQEKMTRLKQLNSLESLSADQQKEAQDIIDQLNSKYGQLGIALDATTGKINGLTDAQTKLNSVMREQVVRQLKVEILERKNNIDELQQEMAAQKKKMEGSYFQYVPYWEDKRAIQQLKNIQNKIAVEEQKLEIVQQKLQDFQTQKFKSDTFPAVISALSSQFQNPGSVSSLLEAAANASTSKVNAKEKANAAKELLKLEEQISDAQKSEMEKQIDSIKKVHAEQRKLLTTMLEFERQRNNPGKAAEYQKRIAESTATELARIAKVRQDAMDEMNRDWNKQQADRARAFAHKLEDREIDQLLNSVPALAAQKLEMMLRKVAQAAKSAREEILKATKDAWSDGILTDKEKQGINDLKETYGAAISRMDALEERLYGARQIMINASAPRMIGSFSSSDLRMNTNIYQQGLRVIKSISGTVEDIKDEVKKNGQTTLTFK